VKACDAIGYIALEDRVAQSGARARRMDEGGRDTVDGNAVPAPFDGQAFCQMSDGCFGMQYTDSVGNATKTAWPTQVHDPPVALGEP